MNEDSFQNRYVHSTIRSVTAKEKTRTLPEKGTLPKDAIMSFVNAKNPSSNLKKKSFFSIEGSRQ